MSFQTRTEFRNGPRQTTIDYPEIQATAGRSFIMGFAVNYIISFGNPVGALVGGTVSTVAALIDTAIRPIIDTLFGHVSLQGVNEVIFGPDSREIINVPSMVRNIMVISLTSLAASAVSPLLGLRVSLYMMTSLFVRMVYTAISYGHSMGSNQLIPIRLA